MLAAGTTWILLVFFFFFFFCGGGGGGICLTLKGFCQQINGEIFAFLLFGIFL